MQIQQFPKMESHLELDGYSLTIENVVIVARKLQEVTYTLSESALARIEASNMLKQQLVKGGQPIYGVTTGFGDSCTQQISASKTNDLQRNLIRYHLNGIGPISPLEVARATMLIRANCLARGNSAVRACVIERLLYFLEQDIIPLIPERGSVGASGDLVPHCYLAAILIGEGKVYDKGIIRDASDVLVERNLQPLVLEAKEGLALINGTSFMSAFACLALWDAQELAFVADICTAMASEALCGNKGHFDPFIHYCRPHDGQLKSAQVIAALLKDSLLAQDYQQILCVNKTMEASQYRELKQPIQDKYSIRCAPQIIGVLYDTLTWCKQWIQTEINSSNDNPLFDTVTQSVHNGGNFYGGHIVQAMDSLKVAVANIADLLDRQLELIVDEKFNNGLTANLIFPFAEDDYEAGLHHGFKGMQLACSAITAEALKMTNPVSVFSRSTEAHNQDKVSLGPIAARDARTIVELVQNVASIHLLALCQALDLRGAERMSSKTRSIYNLIRQHVCFVERDRRMDGDIEQVVQLIRSSELRLAIIA